MENMKAEFSQLTYIFEIYSHLSLFTEVILQQQKLNGLNDRARDL